MDENYTVIIIPSLNRTLSRRLVFIKGPDEIDSYKCRFRLNGKTLGSEPSNSGFKSLRRCQVYYRKIAQFG